MASPIIAPLLFNLSLTQGIVPSDWKLAKVTPIYKGKGSHSEPGNYRPISVVPTVAKLMEKLVKAQLTFLIVIIYFLRHNLHIYEKSIYINSPTLPS